MYLTPQNTPCAVIFAIGSKIVLYCVVITRLEVQEEGKERCKATGGTVSMGLKWEDEDRTDDRNGYLLRKKMFECYSACIEL